MEKLLLIRAIVKILLVLFCDSHFQLTGSVYAFQLNTCSLEIICFDYTLGTWSKNAKFFDRIYLSFQHTQHALFTALPFIIKEETVSIFCILHNQIIWSECYLYITCRLVEIKASYPAFLDDE